VKEVGRFYERGRVGVGTKKRFPRAMTRGETSFQLHKLKGGLGEDRCSCEMGAQKKPNQGTRLKGGWGGKPVGGFGQTEQKYPGTKAQTKHLRGGENSLIRWGVGDPKKEKTELRKVGEEH